jgi:SNF2 family DNA or RNA helicase
MSIPGSFPLEATTDSDSDVEVIPASAFQDNGRRSVSQLNTPQRGMNPFNSASLAERARQTALHRMKNPHLQYGASHNPHGVSLPPPAIMGMQQYGGHFPSYSPYSQPAGIAGAHRYQNGALRADPLQAMIDRTTNMDWTKDPYGHPFSERMEELGDYIGDPRKTDQEIRDLLEHIRPDEDIPKENREGTPDGLKYALYEHQKLALTWLKSMEDGSNKGGILADDMGLGKTISALALILSRPSDDRARKTTLIVGPVALVRQWQREIETKIRRSHSLSTFLAHGGKRVPWDILRTYDIVLTTYGTIGAEYKRKEKWDDKLKANPDMDQSQYAKNFPFIGRQSMWYRIILDEAQCIKNKGTMAAKACCQLKSKFRFCLSGTPMMNGN